ncbi:MAG TPA: N-acetyl sugar amidotransferase [Candidatus Binatia bacterium]
MKYCQVCITPYNRPNIDFDAAGVCNCATSSVKARVDWKQRELAFRKIIEAAKARSTGYDCVIPVSGGKDSTWQVIQCLEYGLTPLAVSWKPPARTAIGAQNLANLIALGVDHIDYQISPKVEKKFMYQALVRYGDPAIPMHMAIFNIPLTIAVKLDIPLVVWGENSAFEYGGTAEQSGSFKLDGAWLEKYGVTHGTTAADWVSTDMSRGELAAYFGPGDETLAARGVLAVFLGYYFRWDPAATLDIARAHGFQARAEGPKTGYYDYADIDDDFISIHHYLKWYKFGFTRLFDNLSLEIRGGRMSREGAIRILRERGDETPHEDIARFCDFVGITREHFFEVIEKFRNPEVWVKRNGKWMIEDFLIPDWEWR